MGFDLVGYKPKNKKGKYFRSNCWWWQRLWRLACAAAELPPKEASKGYTNDGYLIWGKTHKKIIEGLRSSLQNKEKWQGFLDAQEKALVEQQNKIAAEYNLKYDEKCHYPFEWEIVNEFLEFCENNEGFRVC